jgi:hypothetical protein
MRITTIILAILVLITGYGAWLRPDPIAADSLRDHEGKPIGRTDVSIDDIRDLQLVTWDSTLGRESRFQVSRKDDLGWVIPSHSDYPADAEEQVGRTAASVLGKHFGHLVSNDPTDFEQLGVLDPSSAASAEAESGQGTRITLSDASGAPIIDLIIGKPVPDRSGSRFVRETGYNAVYTADINVVFSSRFTDWVKRTLIELTPADVLTAVIDRYQVDETTGRLSAKRETHTLLRSDSAGPWSIGGSVPTGTALDPAVVDTLLTRASDLKLQGVRPSSDQADKARHGFFQSNDGRDYGNEGALFLTTRQGIEYQLYFGEIAVGDGELLSAGGEAGEEEEAAGDNRYLAIAVRYDEKADKELRNAIAAAEAASAAMAATQQATGEGAEAAPVEGGKGEEPSLADRPEEIRQQRREQLEALHRRYQGYYYVIDNASFFELRPDVETLFTVPKPAGEQPATAPAP